MLFPESQHLPDLPVAQRRLPLSHLPRNLRVRCVLLQKRPRRHSRCDGIVGRVEDLEPQAIPLHRQVTDLTEVASVDVAPRIPFPRLGPAYMPGEVARVFVRFDHVSDAEGVDVVVEAAREGARDALAA